MPKETERDARDYGPAATSDAIPGPQPTTEPAITGTVCSSAVARLGDLFRIVIDSYGVQWRPVAAFGGPPWRRAQCGLRFLDGVRG